MTSEHINLKLKPMDFLLDMAIAVHEGRKSVTRRIMLEQPVLEDGFWTYGGAGWSQGIERITPVPMHSLFQKTRYKPGQFVYMREPWACIDGNYFYQADDPTLNLEWKPQELMPREAARTYLRIDRVCLEQVQSIKLADLHKEGLILDDVGEGVDTLQKTILAMGNFHKFGNLWNQTVNDVATQGWDANPWVGVYYFTVVEDND